MVSKEDIKVDEYINLPYLDSINQKTAVNGYVNKLKTPLRNAVNGNRNSRSGMTELIEILEDTLSYINQGAPKPTRKKRTAKKEYDLP